MEIDWLALRPWNGSQRNSFEELCTQLANEEEIPLNSEFVRKGDTDAGIECYWKLENDELWGWQAKFFLMHPPSDSQWTQISKSVKTAINKHNKLKKIYICIPLNRSDPKIEKKKSFMDKWDSNVKKWVDYAKNKRKDIKFKYWGSYEIIKRLSEEKNRGKYLFWFNKNLFSKNWFKSKFLESKSILINKTYFPDLYIIPTVEEKINKSIINDKTLKTLENQLQNLKESISQIPQLNQFYNTNFNDDPKLLSYLIKTSIYYKEIFKQGIKKINDIVHRIKSAQYNFEDIETQFDYDDEFLDDARALFDIDEDDGEECKIQHKMGKNFYDLYDVVNFLLYQKKKCICIEGEAAIGKTSFSFHFIESKINKNHPAILILGKYLTYNNPIEKQILEQLQIKNTTWTEFLKILITISKIEKIQIPIIIDCLHEVFENRNSIKYMKNNLPRLIESLSKYPEIKLIITYRRFYRSWIWKKEYGEEDKIIYTDIYNIEKIIEKFEKHYNIELDLISDNIRHNILKNPLLLRLFCEINAKKNHKSKNILIEEFFINTIFDEYIEIIEENFLEELNKYPNSKFLLKKIYKIAKYLWMNKKKEITIDVLSEILDGKPEHQLEWNNSITKYFICKNILYQISPKCDEVVFSIDLFVGYLISKYLIEKYKNSIKGKNTLYS